MSNKLYILLLIFTASYKSQIFNQLRRPTEKVCSALSKRRQSDAV